MSNIKLAICGDSYMTTDQTGIHWTDQLPPDLHKKILAVGACSNVLIANQVRYAVALGHNHVVVSFTRNSRFEFDRDSTHSVTVTPDLTLAEHYAKRWKHSIMSDAYPVEKKFVDHYYGLVATDFLALQSYHVVLSTLNFLKANNITFAYTLGGTELPEHVFKNMSIPNELEKYLANKISANLWDYPDPTLHGYHVYDRDWQDKFRQAVGETLGVDFC